MSVIKPNSQSWAGHLARIDPQKPPTVLFRNDPQRRRGIGCLKKKCIDGVEQDLTAWSAELVAKGTGQTNVDLHSQLDPSQATNQINFHITTIKFLNWIISEQTK